MVHQRRDEGENGAFVSAASTGRGEDASDPAHQCTADPEAAGLIEEIAHLRSHVSEARWSSKNDAVVLVEFLRRGERCGLIHFRAMLASDFLGHDVRNALESDFDAL